MHCHCQSHKAVQRRDAPLMYEPAPLLSSSAEMSPKAWKRGPREQQAGSSASTLLRVSPSFSQKVTFVELTYSPCVKLAT